MAPPNVLLVAADDLGYGDLGCYGAEYATPNLDRLAGEGIRLTDWHANGPICSPTRASLLTGKYPHRAGVPANAPQGRPETDPDLGLPTDQPTLPSVLSAAGYRTGAFGKWHLGMTDRDDPLAHGFDEHVGFRSGCVDYYSHVMYWVQSHGTPPYHDLWDGRTEIRRDGEYLTDLVTDRAVEFLRAGDDRSDPFFAYVAYSAPHYPLQAPAEYFERFPDLAGDRRTHAAMVATLDDAVGRLLDALDGASVADETLVVFTSDHGPSREVRNHLDGANRPYRGGSAGPFRGGKFSLFEGGTRIPGIVRYPAELPAGETSAGLALTMDVLPTVLDFAGLSVTDGGANEGSDPGFDGESLRSLLAGGESPHDRAFWAFDDQLAVREGDRKLVVDGLEVPPDADERGFERVAGPHLADLAADPAESTNLAGSEPETVERLTDAGRTWLDSVAGDGVAGE
ncbi:MAG: sulfatase [Haloarculaceae archaeon]